MHLRQRLQFWPALVCLAAAACSSHGASSSATVLPATPGAHHQRSDARHKSNASTLYITDVIHALINFYGPSHALLGTITSSLNHANSVAVDASSNLYVGDSAIEVFPGGGNKRVRAYPGGVVLPAAGYDYTKYASPDGAGAFVFGNTLYVTAGITDSTGNHSVIASYPTFTQPADALAKPAKIFYAPTGWCLSDMAGDANGNLYMVLAQGCQPGTFQLREYSPGDTVGKALPMPPAIAHTFAGMVLDGSGDLIMCDREHTQVDVFPPGKTTASRVISNGLKGCGVMAFDSTYSTLYVANQPDVEDGAGFPGVVSAFDYATGTKEYDISKGLDPTSAVIGDIAVDPPAPLGKPYHK